jgi:bacillithiol biosynthesis cysteine-adding enzyme BshC
MEFDNFNLPYEHTGYFSTLVADYISQSPSLRPFYTHSPNLLGIQSAIESRKSFDTPRKLLVEVLTEQYAGVEISNKIKANIESLLKPTCFTVTTAHQPNIFTGPLYFIYKILHTIKLAEMLQDKMPEYNFVPVYYMGSEDADLDELGQINLGGQDLVWKTNQTGAVGRMKVDKAFLQLINAIEGQIAIHSSGLELVNVFKQVYTLGKSIQQATLELVNHLFADYGLVVLIPDNAKLKSAYQSVVKKELVENFSHAIIAETISALKQHYKVQASGRTINLFYLLDNHRERIELVNGMYTVQALNLQFTESEILNELNNYPDRFSANVILRGGFQETVLPNIAFIGGGGELAYWLELKNLFNHCGIPYPVLVLRNSFLCLTQAQFNKMKQLGFSEPDLFQSTEALLNTIVKRDTAAMLDLTNELANCKLLFESLKEKANSVDKSLNDHITALEIQSTKKILALQKKLLRAEKEKFQVAKRQISNLKMALYPNNSLQERVANIGDFYALHGKDFINLIYRASNTLEMQFSILTIKE